MSDKSWSWYDEVDVVAYTNFELSDRSMKNLNGVHRDLVRVVMRAIKRTEVDFAVIEGLRTRARQAELVRTGASQTMNSRHLTGHAVDVAPFVNGQIRWDWPLFLPLADAFRAASEELEIPVEWGGTWDLLTLLPKQITMTDLHPRFPDGPHFQLPREDYSSD